MKKILFALLLMPLLTIGQTSSWRTNPPSPSRSIPSIQGDQENLTDQNKRNQDQI